MLMQHNRGKSPLYGGIEGGGTKFVCAVGTGPEDIRAEARFPTTTPEETLGQVISFFREQIALTGALAAVGFACFGPADPRPGSAQFGQIQSTPKQGWTGVDVVRPLQSALDLPVGFDTDVNGAALGEWRWGVAQGLDTFIYLTIGTGIGGGGLSNGKMMHGLLHPEMGHILIPHDRLKDPFLGSCPFHQDCFEGLAAGPALEKRWGVRAETLPPTHPAWILEADYIALALSVYICTISPQRIILGGGVMQNTFLFPLVRQRVQKILNGYVHVPALNAENNEYIVPPGLANRSGVLGAFALAEIAASSSTGSIKIGK